jgi:hypothetical protein
MESRAFCMQAARFFIAFCMQENPPKASLDEGLGESQRQGTRGMGIARTRGSGCETSSIDVVHPGK